MNVGIRGVKISPEIRAQHQTGTAPSWTGPASSPAFIVEPSISQAALVQAMQKPCQTRIWAQRRARDLELDVSKNN